MNVALMEESIDYDAFPFVEHSSEYPPYILWSGPPAKLFEVELMDKVLQKLEANYKFKLRIVTGKDKPNLKLKTDWEWIPFVGTSYKEQFLGASIGFAWYERNPYSECKGNYKIKTYLAAGCAVVTNSTAYNHVLIDSEQNGVLVDSEEELVDAFRTLLTNHKEREEKRKNSRNFILKNYSTKAIAQKYIQTLKQFNLNNKA
jgi:glycosyltransferase involved in cell wall biosynthesis